MAYTCKYSRFKRPLAYLLPAVRGQVERQHGKKTDSHTRDDDVDSVEERFPTHCYVEGYVQIRLIAARVKLFVPNLKKCFDYSFSI